MVPAAAATWPLSDPCKTTATNGSPSKHPQILKTPPTVARSCENVMLGATTSCIIPSVRITKQTDE